MIDKKDLEGMKPMINIRNFTMDYYLPDEEMVANRNVQIVELLIRHSGDFMVSHLMKNVIPTKARVMSIVEIIGEYTLEEMDEVKDLTKMRCLYLDRPLVDEVIKSNGNVA